VDTLHPEPILAALAPLGYLDLPSWPIELRNNHPDLGPWYKHTSQRTEAFTFGASSIEAIQTIGALARAPWGTALRAKTLSKAGRDVHDLEFRADCADEAINERHVRWDCYLDGVPLDPKLRATSDPRRPAGLGLPFCSVGPRRRAYTRRTLRPPLFRHVAGWHACFAVLQRQLRSAARPSWPTVCEDVLPTRFRRSFRDHPSPLTSRAAYPQAVTLACADETVGARFGRRPARHPPFRPYLTDDVIGRDRRRS